MVSRVEPGLGDPEPVFLWGYPPSRAALANLGSDEGIPVALRAELYWKGVELSNGYDELVDSAEQLSRFQAESRARQALGKPTPPIDHALVDALRAGIPPGSGVALGVDRLVALAYGTDSIGEVIAFPD
jgi:lysyl-tRNA synthetase class 2